MNEFVSEAKDRIYEDILYQLREQHEGGRIDVHDFIHQEVDDIVSSNDRNENLSIIDDTGNENDIDEGMIDRTADIDMQIAQIAYCCLEQELYNDDIFSNIMNNCDSFDEDECKELIEQIEDILP